MHLNKTNGSRSVYFPCFLSGLPSLFYGAVCEQTCTMDDACLFCFSFFFFFLFHMVWFISRANPHLHWPPPACVGLIRQKVGMFGSGFIANVGDGVGFFSCAWCLHHLRGICSWLEIFLFLSVERSQGIVLLEMSFIRLPLFLLGIHSHHRERERKRGRCIISTIRILYYYRVLVLGYWDRGTESGSRYKKTDTTPICREWLQRKLWTLSSMYHSHMCMFLMMCFFAFSLTLLRQCKSMVMSVSGCFFFFHRNSRLCVFLYVGAAAKDILGSHDQIRRQRGCAQTL